MVMAGERILIVEDEEDIQELLRYNLSKEGYRVSPVFTAEEGLQRSLTEAPDLILLDLMLPAMDGLEFCRRLKQDPATRDISVIMVTAKDAESDVIAGLELGADDYITKPFSVDLLITRVQVVLRRRARGPIAETAEMQIEDLVICPARQEVRVGGELVDLTAAEFRVLHLLARWPSWIFTRSKIVDAARGTDDLAEESVDAHVATLRKKLGPAGKHIETVRGVGYRLKE